MEHDECPRLIRRRAICDRLQAFPVGDHLAADALDPLKGCHSVATIPPHCASAQKSLGGMAVARLKNPARVSTLELNIRALAEGRARRDARGVLRSASTHMLIVMALLW